MIDILYNFNHATQQSDSRAYCFIDKRVLCNALFDENHIRMFITSPGSYCRGPFEPLATENGRELYIHFI